MTQTTRTWIGGSLGADEGRWQTGSDWSGGQIPQPGNLDVVDGVKVNVDLIGEVITFPIGFGYTQIDVFPQGASGALGSGDHVTGQTINLSGVVGPPDLVLQGSMFTQDAVDVSGTVVLNSYLNDEVAGNVHVGSGSQHGVLQLQIYGVSVTGAGGSGPVPATTLGGNVTVAGGSQLRVIAVTSQEPDDNLRNIGTIAVQAGGTLFIDDTDGNGIETGADNGTEVINYGLVQITGAAGQSTTATITANTLGPGTIDVAGNGAAQSATTLTLNGDVTNQHLSVDDGTVTINDATLVIGDPSQQGFAVTGGSFTFGQHGGTLLLHQPPLTTLQFIDNDTRLVQLPDGQHPFTTPIFGFGQGDTIGFVRAAQGESFYTVWDQAKHLLSVQFGSSAQYPGIQAQLTLGGTYNAADFHLAVNGQTELLSLTYTGQHTP